MHLRHICPCITLALCLVGACRSATPPPAVSMHSEEKEMSEAAFAKWIDSHVAERRVLETAMATSYWDASGSGKTEDYQRAADAELAFKKLYARTADFEYIKALRGAGVVKEPLLARELEILYLSYLGNQLDPALMERIVKQSSAIEEKFNTYRVDLDGKALSDNDVEHVLSTSLDQEERRRVWEGSKGIGAMVAEDLVALVKLRNEAARNLGYKNYYVLSLAQGEQDEGHLSELLDELAAQTETPFKEVKGEIDAALAERFGVDVAALRPWHYEDRFFQEPPSVGAVDIDPFYEGKDPIALASSYYASIGLPVDTIIARSDLRGREGKYQHAYCIDMDREGDVRFMASVKDNVYWMDTVLHELGHGVYSLGHDRNQALPYLLRDAAHTLTTEGVALLMGRMASNAHWLRRYAGIDETKMVELEPLLRKRIRMGALIFARWCLVMAHFERDLYYNPDQNLNALWWKYVSMYQFVTPPEQRDAPDWASKIHLVTDPVYYHNYLLGEMYAAQLHAAIVRQFYPGQDPWTVVYADNKDVGQFLDEKVFRPGSMWRWDRFVKESTGEELSSRAFAAAYVSTGGK